MNPRPAARGARPLRPAASLFLSLALSGALAFGCAQSAPEATEPCARAVDKLENECGFSVTGADGGTDFNCTGSAACAADCLYEASCADIKKNAPAFTDCLDGCK